jgi:DNA repair ATPase RecN
MNKDTAKTVRVIDNELYIENDNALITNSGTTSQIVGDYYIHAEDVKRLMAIVNGGTTVNSVYVPAFMHNLEEFAGVEVITNEITSKLIKNMMDNHQEECSALRETYEKYYDKWVEAESNYKNLLEQIKEYNSKRLFNKFKIK